MRIRDQVPRPEPMAIPQCLMFFISHDSPAQVLFSPFWTYLGPSQETLHSERQRQSISGYVRSCRGSSHPG
jgi:hypothetical protein